MSLLVIGSVAFDAIETPFGKTDKIIGGAATYIALSSSYLEDTINLVAVVGGDFPKEDIPIRTKGQTNPFYGSMVTTLDWSLGRVINLLKKTDDPRNPGKKLCCP